MKKQAQRLYYAPPRITKKGKRNNHAPDNIVYLRERRKRPSLNLVRTATILIMCATIAIYIAIKGLTR